MPVRLPLALAVGDGVSQLHALRWVLGRTLPGRSSQLVSQDTPARTDGGHRIEDYVDDALDGQTPDELRPDEERVLWVVAPRNLHRLLAASRRKLPSTRDRPVPAVAQN